MPASGDMGHNAPRRLGMVKGSLTDGHSRIGGHSDLSKEGIVEIASTPSFSPELVLMLTLQCSCESIPSASPSASFGNSALSFNPPSHVYIFGSAKHVRRASRYDQLPITPGPVSTTQEHPSLFYSPYLRRHSIRQDYHYRKSNVARPTKEFCQLNHRQDVDYS